MTATQTLYREGYLRPHWPQEIRDQLIAYIENGKEPCEFLKLILQNDLKGSFRAAEEHRQIFAEIIQFLFSFAPPMCWGGPISYSDWVFAGGLYGTGWEDEREHA